VFLASVSVLLLSFAHDKFSDRDSGDSPAQMSYTIFANGTIIVNSNANDTPTTERWTDSFIYACFYFSTLLSIIYGAFSWLTHENTLRMLVQITAEHAIKAQADQPGPEGLASGQSSKYELSARQRNNRSERH
jgi:hypothetical protein